MNYTRKRPLERATRALLIARECGDETYPGRPCRYKHSGTRWTKNTRCVECSPKREKTLSPRRVAFERGDRYFEGKPCKWCAGTSRYTVNGTCVSCANSRTLRAYRTDPEVRERVKAQAAAWQKSNPLRYTLKQAEARSRRRGMDFDLIPEDVPVPSHCPILGIPLDSRDRDHTPSLDRIENDQGYVVGNVAVISMRANRIKSDAMLEELEAIIAFMKRHRNLAANDEKPIDIKLVA